MNKHQFSRRTFLRGMGVTMALPWLESANVWGDEPKKNRPASEAPVRVAALFSGNGFHSKEWWAKGEGKAMELGQVLAPLNDFRTKLLFVKGLYHEEARKGNIHSSQTGNLLSGAPITSGGEIRSGTSFDQLVAQSYGRSTKVPSLVLACERSFPGVHKNYSMLYSSHISWSTPTSPRPARRSDSAAAIEYGWNPKNAAARPSLRATASHWKFSSQSPGLSKVFPSASVTRVNSLVRIFISGSSRLLLGTFTIR